MTNLLQAAKNVPAKWERGDLAGAVRELAAATEAMPKFPEAWKNYDHFEVHPCILVQGEEPGDESYEQCEENDPEIFCWTLYGHIRYETKTHPEGGIEDIVDFPKFSRDTAFFVRDLLIALYSTL